MIATEPVGGAFGVPACTPKQDEGLRTALCCLLEAHRLVYSLGRDPWDFALDLFTLRAAGTTDSTLRWLVCRGYLSQAIEETVPTFRAPVLPNGA